MMHEPNKKTTSLLALREKWILLAVVAVCGGAVVAPSLFLMLVGLVIGTAVFALLWRDAREPLYLLVLPAAYLFGLLFAWFGDFVAPVAAIAPILGGLVLAEMLMRHKGRTTQVLLTLCAVSAPFLVLAAVEFFQKNGLPSFAELREILDALEAQYAATIQTLFQDLLAMQPAETRELYASLFSAETARELAWMVLVCVGPLVVDFFLLAAYLATTAYVQAVRIFRVERYLPDAPYVHTVSLGAAVLFTVAFILSVLVPNDVVYAVSTIVVLLLLPALALLAVKRYLWRRRNGLLSRNGNAVLILFVLLLVFYLPMAFYLLGLCGAYEVIGAAWRRRK